MNILGENQKICPLLAGGTRVCLSVSTGPNYKIVTNFVIKFTINFYRFYQIDILLLGMQSIVDTDAL